MCKISLAMIAKNEEEKLGRCLKSVKGIVDEIIVVDTGSDDATKKIALENGAKVYDFEWIKDFSAARNFALEKASGDYVLVLDADDYIIECDIKKIKEIIKSRKIIGRVEILDEFLDNGETSYMRNYTSRFLPKGVRYKGKIHEQPDSDLERITIPLKVYHDGYLNRSEEDAKRNIEILQNELKEHKNPYFMFQLGHEYCGQKRYEEADKLLSKSYKNTPRKAAYHPKLLIEYLNTLMNLEKYEDALRIVKKEEKYYCNFADFNFNCGLLYMNLVLSNPQKYMQYLDLIEKSYKKCLEIGETEGRCDMVGMGSYLPLHNLGALYEVVGDFDRAKDCYKRAAELGHRPSKERYEILLKKNN